MVIMNAEVYITLSVAGIIIIVGSIGSYLFKKTGIPDMVFLIGLGALLGPVLKIVPHEKIIGAAPILAALALLIILFDGGLSLDLAEIFSHAPRALLLAVLGFTINVLAVMVFLKMFLGLRFLYGALLGSIVGGSSSIIVVTLAQKAKASNEARVILILESAMTDVLCTVVALALIHVIMVGGQSYYEMTKSVIANFTTGSFIGAIMGIFWLGMLRKIRREPYQYMLTLAVMLLGYVFAENIGGSGAISVLIFGIILGNERGINKLIRRPETPRLFDKEMRRLEDEMVFLIKSFFFVYLGIIIHIGNLLYAVLGVILSIIFLGARYLVVAASTIKSNLREERGLMTFMFARGLAAAVLATLVSSLNIPFSDLFINVAFVVILVSGILCSLGTYKFTAHKSIKLRSNRIGGHLIP